MSNNPKPGIAEDGTLASNNQQMESNTPPWIGLDIGATNLKAAHTNGWSRHLSFDLSSKPNLLATSLAGLLDSAPPFVGVGLAITGDSASCFLTRAHGVAHILEQVTSIIPAVMIRVYSGSGEWLSPGAAAREPWKVSSANWHALSQLLSFSLLDGRSLIADIGSNAIDLIPLESGRILIEGQSDSQRLQSGALVYSGFSRTLVSVVTRTLPLFGAPCPVIGGACATVRDAHNWLGDQVDAPECRETGDGRPATRECSRYRLAGLVGEDGATLADTDIDAIAMQVRRDQVKFIAEGIKKVCMNSYASQANLKAKKRKVRGKASIATPLSDASSTSHAILKDSDSSQLDASSGAFTSPTATSSAAGRPDRIVVLGQGRFLLEDALQHLEWKVPLIPGSQYIGMDLIGCEAAYAVAQLASK